MSYYGAGDYYAAGGYYQAGGIFSAIGSAVKKVAGVGLGIAAAAGVPGASIVSRALAPMPRGAGGGPVINVPFGGPPGAGIGAIGTPAHMATYLDRRFYTKDGRPRRIRKDGKPWGIPSMDPGNTRALQRATRRTNRFVKIARAALGNTKYGIYTRASRGGKRKR